MIETFDTPEALADAAADAVIHALDAALKARGSASLGVTGGRSPGAVYDRLAFTPLDWRNIRVTLTDERWVDVQSPDSNERLVRSRLLRGRAEEARFYGLRGADPAIDTAVLHANAVLNTWPPFDVVLLGMGEDGHVASLFPGSPVLAEGLSASGPACIAVPAGEGGAPPAQPRISLTLGPLVRAGLVLILTRGAAKRAVLEQAQAGADPMRLPVSAVLRSSPSARLLWTA